MGQHTFAAERVGKLSLTCFAAADRSDEDLGLLLVALLGFGGGAVVCGRKRPLASCLRA